MLRIAHAHGEPVDTTRLPELLGDLERGRQCQFAEFRLLGLLDGHLQINAVSRRNMLVKGSLNPFF